MTNFTLITRSMSKFVCISNKICLVVFKSEVFEKDFNEFATALKLHLKVVEAVDSPIRVCLQLAMATIFPGW